MVVRMVQDSKRPTAVIREYAEPDIPGSIEYIEFGRADRVTLAILTVAVALPLILWALPMPWSALASVAFLITAVLMTTRGPSSAVTLDRANRRIARVSSRRQTSMRVESVVSVDVFKVPYGPPKMLVRDSAGRSIEFAVDDASELLRIKFGETLAEVSAGVHLSERARRDLGMV